MKIIMQNIQKISQFFRISRGMIVLDERCCHKEHVATLTQEAMTNSIELTFHITECTYHYLHLPKTNDNESSSI